MGQVNYINCAKNVSSKDETQKIIYDFPKNSNDHHILPSSWLNLSTEISLFLLMIQIGIKILYPRGNSGGKRLLSDLERFLEEVEKTGGRREGTVLCNSEVRKCSINNGYCSELQKMKIRFCSTTSKLFPGDSAQGL